jgi:hypothetical protein
VRTLRGHSHPNRAHGSATSARADARPVATRSPRPGHAPVPAQRGPEWSGAILQRTGGAHGGPSAGSRPVHANFAVPGRGSPLGAAGHLLVRDSHEGPSGRGSGRPERAQGWRAPRATRGARRPPLRARRRRRAEALHAWKAPAARPKTARTRTHPLPSCRCRPPSVTSAAAPRRCAPLPLLLAALLLAAATGARAQDTCTVTTQCGPGCGERATSAGCAARPAAALAARALRQQCARARVAGVRPACGGLASTLAGVGLQGRP